MAAIPKDRNGKDVHVGSRVKIIAIDPRFLESLPNDEKEDVASMLNEVFEVYEIDEYGQSWVEKGWAEPGGDYRSHSLALSSSEMELY